MGRFSNMSSAEADQASTYLLELVVEFCEQAEPGPAHVSATTDLSDDDAAY